MLQNIITQLKKPDAPAGIRTRVSALRGLGDWPDYTTGAYCAVELRETHPLFKLSKSLDSTKGAYVLQTFSEFMIFL